MELHIIFYKNPCKSRRSFKFDIRWETHSLCLDIIKHVWLNLISDEINQSHLKLVFEDEVREVVISLGAYKASGPNGFHAFFF